MKPGVAASMTIAAPTRGRATGLAILATGTFLLCALAWDLPPVFEMHGRLGELNRICAPGSRREDAEQAPEGKGCRSQWRGTFQHAVVFDMPRTSRIGDALLRPGRGPLRHTSRATWI